MADNREKKGGKAALGIAAGIGALIGGALVAGISFLASENKNTDEEKKSEVTEEQKEEVDHPTAHIPPSLDMPDNVPDSIEQQLLCPISLEIMTDPVVTPYGHTYDRKSIESYLEKEEVDPITREPLKKSQLAPNYTIREMIEHFNATSKGE